MAQQTITVPLGALKVEDPATGTASSVTVPLDQLGSATLADLDPDKGPGTPIGRFVEGAMSNLNPITAVTGLAQAALHPVDTASGLLTTQMEQLRQAKQLYSEGRYSEAAGHLGAWLLPILGPAAAHAGERAGQGDIAGGLGEGAGLLAPLAAADAAKAGAKAAKLIPKTGREVVASRLQQIANDKITDVIAPKVGANKVRFGNMAEKVAPELAKAGDLKGAWSREGLHATIEGKLAEAETALDETANARLSARTVPTQPIIQDLIAKRRKLTAEPVEASHVMPSVTAGTARGIPVDPMRTYALRWMKEDMDNLPFVKRSFNYPKGQGSTPEVVAGAAGSPIYRAIVGEEGRELISASRGDVIKAIKDVLEGKTDGKLRQLVVGVADDLAKGDSKVQKRMVTSGPNVEPGDLTTTRWRDLKNKTAAPELTKEGRALGEAVTPGPNSDRIAAIDKAIAEVKQLGPVARYEPLRRIREAWDQPAKVKYNPSLTQDFLKVKGYADGAADVTGTLRETLAKFDPETAKANAQYSLYRKASDVLKAAEEVERTRPKVGRQIMARLTGSVVGEQAAGVPGAAVGFVLGPIVDQMVSSGVTTKLQTARLLTQLSEAIRKGDVGQSTGLIQRIKAMSRAGMLGERVSASAPRESAAPAATQ